MTRTSILFTAVCILAAAIPSLAQPTITVSLSKNNTVEILSCGPSGIATAVLTVSNVPEGPLRTAKPTIVDKSTGQPSVAFEAKQQLPGGDNPAVIGWIVNATVAGLAPGSSESRTANVAIHDKQFPLAFTVANLQTKAACPLGNTPAVPTGAQVGSVNVKPADPAGGTSTWSVAVPSAPWIITWEGSDTPLSVTVTTNDMELKGLRVVQSTLRDSLNLAQIGPEQLEVNPNSMNLPPRSTRSVAIRLKDPGSVPPHGKFTGNIVLGADNTPNVQTAAVTLNASSLVLRALGTALIALGLWLSWILLHYLGPQVVRAQAMKPVLRTRRAISDIRAKVADLNARSPYSFDLIGQRLDRIDKSVSTAALDADDLLPRGFDAPFGGASAPAAKLQERLTSVGAEMSIVATVIRNGIVPAIDDSMSGNYDPEKLKTAMKGLDEVGDTAATQSAAEVLIPAILNHYRLPVGVQADAALARRLDPGTPEEADYVIQHASQIAWWIWGITAGLTGFMILVLPNSGFGWADLAYCFLWGLGLPTAGAAFQSLTPSGVATSIGVSVPKT